MVFRLVIEIAFAYVADIGFVSEPLPIDLLPPILRQSAEVSQWEELGPRPQIQVFGNPFDDVDEALLGIVGPHIGIVTLRMTLADPADPTLMPLSIIRCIAG